MVCVAGCVEEGQWIQWCWAGTSGVCGEGRVLAQEEECWPRRKSAGREKAVDAISGDEKECQAFDVVLVVITGSHILWQWQITSCVCLCLCWALYRCGSLVKG